MLQEALVLIGSAVILVPIFQRLGLGSVLGYLLAGIVVGPEGFKLITDTQSIPHLAELGIVLLLFMIGLEIQPRKLWSMRRHLLGLGGTQIVLTSILFSMIAILFGLSPVAASVIGFALSLSSTAFALQTLAEQNQLNTEQGRASLSILLMQDMVSIPALAIIPSLSTSGSSAHSLSLQGSLLVIAVVMCLVVASRYLMRPVFRFIALTRSREIFTATTLLIVLGVAVAMQKVGFSAALGTFIAGVLLADSEYRHELESNLEPFKGLLMGLFFIAVGMGVSLNVVTQHPFLIVSMALAYLLIKMSLIYLSSRMLALSHKNAKLTALTIAQGGEFAFLIFAIALQLKLIPSSTLSWLVAVITISMALSPFLAKAHDRWMSRLSTEPEYDKIPGEQPQVIIAGFGRFGQTFGRILRSQGIPFLAIDHDPDQIELVRRFGNKVYYGDASRLEILEAAGASKAKYFILAIDDVEKSLEAAQLVHEHFPNLKLFARARNRGHVYDLMALGIHFIKRETFDSSANFVEQLLVDMGYPAESAASIIKHFMRHDEIMLAEQFKVRGDDKMLISLSKQGVAQLAAVLQQESLQSYVDPAGK